MRKETSLSEKDWAWARPLQDLFGKQPVGDREVVAIEYAKVERDHYVAEVGKKCGDYIYHFYRRDIRLGKVFSEKLGDAFLATFRIQERLSWDHVYLLRCFTDGCAFKGRPEDILQRPGDNRAHCPDCDGTRFEDMVDSWSVRAAGFADNPMADELAVRVFDELDKLLT